MTNWKKYSTSIAHRIPASGAEQPPWVSYFSATWARHTVHPLKGYLQIQWHGRSKLYRNNTPGHNACITLTSLSLGENTLLDNLPGPNLRLKIPNDATSLVAQWLRLCASSAGGPGSIPGQGTKSHVQQLRAHVQQLKTPHVAMKIPCAATKARSNPRNKYF